MSNKQLPTTKYKTVIDPFDGTVKVYSYDEVKEHWYLYSLFFNEVHAVRHLNTLTSRGGRVLTAGRG